MRCTVYLLVSLTLLLTACETIRESGSPSGRDGRSASEPHECSHPFEFIVVQLNDVYEMSPLDGGRVGGMSRVATLLNELKEKNPNTISVMAGDFLSPSLLGSLKKVVNGKPTRIAGEHVVAVMNATGIDYATFGNHEFDISMPSLQARLNESDFSYVSANVFHNTASGLQPFEQIRGGHSTPVPEYVVHDFARPGCKPVRLGLIGLTLPFNRKNYVHYEDVFTAGQRSFDAAQANSDLVFGLTHLSIDSDQKLAQQIPGLPLIMGGHEHEDIEIVSGRTLITKADANARTIYIHWVTYDPQSGDSKIWSQLMPVTEDIEADADVESVVQSWESIAEDAISEMGFDPGDVVARFKEPYDGREVSVRNHPTNLGQAIACAMLAEDQRATVAILGSGSIRVDDVLIGGVTQRDVLRTLPFGGPIVHARFRGSVLKRILQVGFYTNTGEGGYLQTTPNLTEKDGLFLINGVALEDNRTYEVVLNEFLTLGKESNLGFMAKEGQYETLTLTGVDGSSKNDLRDVTIKYLKSKTNYWQQCTK